MNAQLLAWLNAVHPSLSQLSGFPLWVFLLVVTLTGLFLIGYLIQGTRLWWQLSSACRGIGRLSKDSKQVDPERVKELLRSEPLAHLWEEYDDTLHEVKTAANGDGAITQVRATVPAETFFTREVLVDSRLFDDFARHLPGVLTGLGIIGTFSGLLQGLEKFDPSSTEKAVSGLAPLMAGVEHAFVASAIAIGAAMAVTFLSKLVLAYFYRLVEKLNHAVDALYRTGAGEEYLARLVQSSERAEGHAAQLKDALVEDLTKLMTNLAERQMESQALITQKLGEHIGDSIKSSLAAPIERMTEAMEQTSRGNGEQVSGMLETMLTGFMAKLEDTFGGQMRGINDQMDRSMQAMTAVQQAMQQLVGDIARTNEQASDQMTLKLEEAIEKSAANQALMTDQMREFVQEFRKLVTEERDKSARAMDDAVTGVLQQLSAAMTSMEATRIALGTQEHSRSENLAHRTTELVGGLSGQVDSLLKAVTDQVSHTQRNIDALQAVSLRAIDGMSEGALTMGTAAQRFESAGSSVSTVLERSSAVTKQLSESSGALQLAANAVRQGFEQYDGTRKSVEGYVGVLTTLIESAKKEAGVSQAMLGDMERIVAELRTAEDHSKLYLEGVNATLVKAFEEFGNALTNQLRKAIGETDRHLGDGVQQLNGVVQGFAMAFKRLETARA
ncbi:anti-phage ZorAB system protein ZorA [Variovorax sp. LjRoot178]|uniref:anti-phage ZorAB system protein ZorA n=1 Tax=Variovorax sp. LjRoot178 TaxID=3342277 RepID=UPI003ECE4484